MILVINYLYQKKKNFLHIFLNPIFIKEKELINFLTMNRAIFITGLSSSGKTTLAYNLIKKLSYNKIKTILLDGTEMFNFSILYPFKGHEPEDRASRSKHLMRMINWVNSQNLLPIIPIVGQPIKIRDDWKKSLDSYVEIFLDCDINICKYRDNKNLYESFEKGKASSIIGVDRIFDKPLNPWLKIDSGKNNSSKVFEIAWEKISKLDFLNDFKINI